MKLISVVGARPNFMKIAPFIRAVDRYNLIGNVFIEHILVHTGQHYDYRMSEAFFQELGIKDPEINLGVGSGSHAEQIGTTMIEFEKTLHRESPDWVIVVGDVNATLACSVVAKKLNIKVCHIEAGLRSGDMTMPEEINRLVTDRISDLLLTPDYLSSENLIKEGVPDDRIEMVGNIMIDTLEFNREKASLLDINDIIVKNTLAGAKYSKRLGNDEPYSVVTLHRPSNVDERNIFESIAEFICTDVAKDLYVLWPVHPRALKNLKETGLINMILKNEKVILMEPISYLEMLRLNFDARIILTDSGGLQEECCITGTPCLTLRWNTERPVTLRKNGGVCETVGNDIGRIRTELNNFMFLGRIPSRPEKWDGKTAERCVESIVRHTDYKKI